MNATEHKNQAVFLNLIPYLSEEYDDASWIIANVSQIWQIYSLIGVFQMSPVPSKLGWQKCIGNKLLVDSKVADKRTEPIV